MESLNGGGKDRDCAIVGALTLCATLVGAAAASGLGATAAFLGGVMTGASMGCF